MFLIFRRSKEMKTFAAFLILGYLLTANSVAQTAVVTAGSASQKSEQVSAAIQAEKPKRSLPPGVRALEGFNSPVYLYAPKGLEANKKYPLLFMVPSQTDTAEEQMEYIFPTAKSLECFVIAPFNNWPQDTPYEMDRWLLKVKNTILLQYPIDPSKIFAIGRNSGGEYAAYLITAYPDEFSGAALIGEAWAGRFAELLRPQVLAGDQMPVVAAFTANQQDKKLKNEKWVLEYQKKGYPVQLMEPPAGQDLNSPEFKVALLEWLDTKSKAWKLVREEKAKTFGQRLRQGVIEFFAV